MEKYCATCRQALCSESIAEVEGHSMLIVLTIAVALDADTGDEKNR